MKVQTQVQTQLKDAEPPKVQDLQGLLKNAGVTLTDDQQVALSAYVQTMQQPAMDEDDMLDLGGGWLSEALPPDMFAAVEAGVAQDNASFGPSRVSRKDQRSNPLSRGDNENS